MRDVTLTRSNDFGPAALRLEWITDAAGFAALEGSWNAAVGRAATPSIFLRHEWFAAAWAWRQSDAALALLTARADDRLAGILPLIRLASPRKRMRRLELLTVPDTQLADMIAAPAEVEAVADAFARELAHRSDWDTLRLDYLPPRGTIAAKLVPALRRHGLDVEEQARTGNPFIALDGVWNDYYNTRTRSLKKALNLAANRLRRIGPVRIEWLASDTADEPAFARALDTAIDISRRSWKRSTGNALDRPGPQSFIRALSAVAYRRGWASIWLLYVDQRPLAMEYQLIDGGIVHALRADFDADCEEVSPGSHLFGKLLERLFDRGFARYCMGPGDNAYKKRWTERSDPLHRVVVFNRSLLGRWAWLRDVRVKPALRAARARLTGAGGPPRSLEADKRGVER